MRCSVAMIYSSVDYRNVVLSEISFCTLFVVPTIKNSLNLETSLICFSLEWLAHAFCGATPSHGIARFVLFLATYRLRILDLHMPSQNLCQVFTAMTTFAISESPVLSMAAFLYPSFGKAKKKGSSAQKAEPKKKGTKNPMPSTSKNAGKGQTRMNIQSDSLCQNDFWHSVEHVNVNRLRTNGDGACSAHAAWGVCSARGELVLTNARGFIRQILTSAGSFEKVREAVLVSQPDVWHNIQGIVMQELFSGSFRNAGDSESNAFLLAMRLRCPDMVSQATQHVRSRDESVNAHASAKYPMMILAKQFFSQFKDSMVLSLFNLMEFDSRLELSNPACFEDQSGQRMVVGTREQFPVALESRPMEKKIDVINKTCVKVVIISVRQQGIFVSP